MLHFHQAPELLGLRERRGPLLEAIKGYRDDRHSKTKRRIHYWQRSTTQRKKHKSPHIEVYANRTPRTKRGRQVGVAAR